MSDQGGNGGGNGGGKDGTNITRRLNGGQALAEMLKAHGVGPMFGMGGFQLLPFYGASPSSA